MVTEIVVISMFTDIYSILCNRPISPLNMISNYIFNFKVLVYALFSGCAWLMSKRNYAFFPKFLNLILAYLAIFKQMHINIVSSTVRFHAGFFPVNTCINRKKVYLKHWILLIFP